MTGVHGLACMCSMHVLNEYEWGFRRHRVHHHQVLLAACSQLVVNGWLQIKYVVCSVPCECILLIVFRERAHIGGAIHASYIKCAQL